MIWMGASASVAFRSLMRLVLARSSIFLASLASWRLNDMDGRECICGLSFPDEAGARQILYLLGVLGVLAVE
jgi:hypothetical protein